MEGDGGGLTQTTEPRGCVALAQDKKPSVLLLQSALLFDFQGDERKKNWPKILVNNCSVDLQRHVGVKMLTEAASLW